MGLLSGRRGLVVGIANQRSLAYGIAKAARAEGAELALTYQNERLLRSIEPIASELGADIVVPCDVSVDAEITHLAQTIRDRWGQLDFLVHAVAFANREELDGRFVDTSRQGFAQALDISVYSLVALTHACQDLLSKTHGSVLTLSYHASRQAVPHYNVMGVAKAALESSVRFLARDLGPQGIRVNALSAGPVRTLSAAGVPGLRSMLQFVENESPLRRNVTIDDVGRAALFALSDLGGAMTGETFHVDSGMHAIGAAPASDIDLRAVK